MNSQPPKIKFLLSFVFIIISCLLFFSKGIFLDKRTIIWDAADEFFPLLWYTGHLWKNGILPLWNPFLFNGYPIFVDPQNQTFYPINIIISFLTVFSAKVVYFQIVLHFLLAGISMYLFSGFYIRNNAGRLIAALVYMFNGFMVNHFQHLTMINAVAWLPLTLFFLEKGWKEKKVVYFMPAGISIALSVLAGHPQTLLYMLYISLSLTVFKCLSPNHEKRFSFFPLKLTMLSMIFGFLLSAIQLIPSYEFSTMANRSGPLPYWIVALISGQLHPAHLVTLFLPDYFGTVKGPYVGLTDIAHSSIYCGVIFLGVLPYTFEKRRKEIIFFWFMSILTLFIAMGDFGIIFRFFYKYLPGFNLFRSPVQYRFGLAFFAAILTGIAIDNIISKNIVKRRIHYVYQGVVFLLIMVMVIFAIVTPLKEKVLSNVFRDAIIFSVLFLMFTFILLMWEKKKLPLTILQLTLFLLAFIDFYIHGADALTIGSRMRHNEMEKEPAVLSSLKSKLGQSMRQEGKTPFLSSAEIENGLYRVYVDDGDNNHVRFLPYFPYDFLKLGIVGFNRTILHKVFMVDGYNPIILKRYILFNGTFRDRDYQKFRMLSNVKYIIKPGGAIEVLSDEETLPRSYLVTRTRYIRNPDLIIDELSDPSFDIRNEAVVEYPLELPKAAFCGERKEAKVVEYFPNRIKLATECDCSALLVLSDTYYPGWKVRIDSDVRTDAMKVNYCFMGAVIPSGKHNVIFEFDPISFKIGLIITVLSVVSGITIYLGLVRKQKHIM
ncbi:MAG: hypothetical protein A2Y66_05015 [Nitrospirae bacterium RBG_13_41_22]|nr:MAG: hypothetical protein A2Y66_05015 [Nitrospirae bacterium RBG_13_41_22]